MANQIAVEAVTSTAEFRIEVSGNVWPEPGTPAGEFAQEGTHYSETGGWIEFSGDTALTSRTEMWNYDGDVTSWEVMSGDTNEYLNGAAVTAGQVVAHYDHYPKDRVWFIAGSDSSFSYDISIEGGTMNGGAGFGGSMSSRNASDSISNGEWSDVYFDGEITNVDVSGNGVMYHNCQQVDPSSYADPAAFELVSYDLPMQVANDEVADADVVVKNVGGSRGSVTTKLQVGNQSGSDSATLDPGGTNSTTFTIDGSGFSAGTYDMVIFINGDERHRATVEMLPPEEVSWSVSTSVPSTISAGSSKVADVDVTNTGNVQGSPTVEFVVGGLSASQQPTLSPGETASLSYELDSGQIGTGSHTWEVYVDGAMKKSGSLTVEEAAPPDDGDDMKWVVAGIGVLAGLYVATRKGKNLNEAYDEVVDDVAEDMDIDSQDDGNA